MEYKMINVSNVWESREAKTSTETEENKPTKINGLYKY